MMTRKDFETIASAIRGLALNLPQLEIVIARFSVVLKTQNPNFDPVKFRKACLEDNR